METNAKMMEIDKKMGSIHPTEFDAYLDALDKHAGSDIEEYLKWKGDKTATEAAAVKPPTAAQIVAVLHTANFADEDSLAKLCSIVWADGTADVLIATSSKLRLAMRPSVDALATVEVEKDDFKPEESLTDDKPADFDPSKYKAPTFNPYLIALTADPSLPTPDKASSPPTIALQLGALVSTTAPSPTESDWSDTNFVILMNPIDSSLWIAFNYAPYDELGGRAPIDIKKTPGGSFDGLPDEKTFDIAMLLSGADVKKWDAGKPFSADIVAQTIVATRSRRGLTAKNAEPRDLATAGLQFHAATPAA